MNTKCKPDTDFEKIRQAHILKQNEYVNKMQLTQFEVDEK